MCLLCLLDETLKMREEGTWRQDGVDFGRSSQGSKNQTSEGIGKAEVQ